MQYDVELKLQFIARIHLMVMQKRFALEIDNQRTNGPVSLT